MEAQCEGLAHQGSMLQSASIYSCSSFLFGEKGGGFQNEGTRLTFGQSIKQLKNTILPIAHTNKNYRQNQTPNRGHNNLQKGSALRLAVVAAFLLYDEAQARLSFVE